MRREFEENSESAEDYEINQNLLDSLIDAIKDSDINAVRNLAQRIQDINETYIDGCFYGNESTILQEAGLPPLCYAMNLPEGKIRDQIIKILEKNGADIVETPIMEEKNGYKYEDVYEYILYVALYRLEINLLKFLLKNFPHQYRHRKIQFLQDLLDDICQYFPKEFKEGEKGYEILSYLLDNIILDLNYTLDEDGDSKQNLFISLTKRSAGDCLRLLHSKVKNLNVNFKDTNGWTAAHYLEDVETAKLLINDLGADPVLEGKNGETPLMVMVQDYAFGVARFLVEKCGCDVFRTDSNQRNLFHYLAYSNVESSEDFWEFFSWLEEKQLDPNAYDDNGYTPFHLACVSAEGQSNTIKYFLMAGVDYNKKTGIDNKNALELLASEINLVPENGLLSPEDWKIFRLVLCECPEMLITDDISTKLKQAFLKVSLLDERLEFVSNLINSYYARSHMQEINHQMNDPEAFEIFFEAILNDNSLVMSDFSKLISELDIKDSLSLTRLNFLMKLLLKIYGSRRESFCDAVYVHVAEQFYDKAFDNEENRTLAFQFSVLFFLCSGNAAVKSNQFYLGFAALVSNKHPNTASVKEPISHDFNIKIIIENYPDESLKVLQEIESAYTKFISETEDLCFSTNPCANILRLAERAAKEKLKKENELFKERLARLNIRVEDIFSPHREGPSFALKRPRTELDKSEEEPKGDSQLANIEENLTYFKI